MLAVLEPAASTVGSEVASPTKDVCWVGSMVRLWFLAQATSGCCGIAVSLWQCGKAIAMEKTNWVRWNVYIYILLTIVILYSKLLNYQRAARQLVMHQLGPRAQGYQKFIFCPRFCSDPHVIAWVAVLFKNIIWLCIKPLSPCWKAKWQHINLQAPNLSEKQKSLTNPKQWVISRYQNEVYTK